MIYMAYYNERKRKKHTSGSDFTNILHRLRWCKKVKKQKKDSRKPYGPGTLSGIIETAQQLCPIADFLQMLHQGTDEVNTSFPAQRSAVEDEIIAFGASPFFVRKEIVVKASVLIHLFDERFRFFC